MSTQPKAASPASQGPTVKARTVPATQNLFVLSTKSLFFPPPYNRLIQNTFTLTNNSPTPVVFKLRSSDATAFWARPKVGIVAAGASDKIRVVLLENQAPPNLDKCRFFVEGRKLSAVPAGETPMKSVWESAEPASMFNFVLSCKVPEDSSKISPGTTVTFPSQLPTSKREPSASRQPSSAGQAAPAGLGGAPSAATAAPTGTSAAATASGAAATAVGPSKHAAPVAPNTGDVAARQQRAAEDLKRAKAAGNAIEAKRTEVVQAGSSAAVKAGQSRSGGVRLSVAVFLILMSYACGLFIGQDMENMVADKQ